MPICQTEGLFWKFLVRFFKGTCALSAGFKMKLSRRIVFHVKTKTNSNFAVKLCRNNLSISFKESVSVKEFKQKLYHVQKIDCSCVAYRRLFLSAMSVLVFVKLFFISLVTIVWPILKIQETPYNCLFPPTSCVVLDYHYGIPEFLNATFRKLGSGHQTLLLTDSEQNQNPVSDSAYSIESIGSNVATFRNSLLTSNVTLWRNTERNFHCEKLNYVTSSYLGLFSNSRREPCIFFFFFRKHRSFFWSNYRNFWALDAGPWMLDSGRWTLDSGHWTLDSGLWTLDAGLWTLDAGLWTLDPGCWTLDAGLWTLKSGLWTLVSL